MHFLFCFVFLINGKVHIFLTEAHFAWLTFLAVWANRTATSLIPRVWVAKNILSGGTIRYTEVTPALLTQALIFLFSFLDILLLSCEAGVAILNTTFPASVLYVVASVTVVVRRSKPTSWATLRGCHYERIA